METPFTYTIVYRVTLGPQTYVDYELFARALARFLETEGSVQIEQITVKKLLVLSK